MTDDIELLERFAAREDERAFGTLVERHVSLVYSTARRVVNGDTHLAEDVAQKVFTDLARKARSLPRDTVLTGWLYEAARFTAANTIRGERRRQAREEEVIAMQTSTPEPDAAWEQIAPHLDDAMGELPAADRHAILLRYFQNHDFAAVGRALGVSDDAAQKRVSRAVDRLREFLAQRGVTVGAGGLVVVISTNAVLMAPAGLSAAITSAVCATVATTTLTHAAIITMNWINAKSAAAILGAAILAGTGTYFVQNQRLSLAEARQRELLNQQTQLAAARDEALATAQAKNQEIERLRKDAADLARLRNDVTQLRQQLAAQKTPAAPPIALPKDATTAVAHPPGSYIAKAQLANVGFATPEAALETITWTMMVGTYDQVNEAAGHDADEEAKEPNNRAEFTARQQVIAPLFKGMQIVAKKVLTEDKVELKVRHEYDPAVVELNKRPMPSFYRQPMVRVGTNWRLGGSTREHTPEWDTTGQIQTFTP